MEPHAEILPFVTCLCPTFHRPKLLANALACFLAQDYPADRCELIIVDDGNDFDHDSHWENNHQRWQIYSAQRRYESLPKKFNEAAEYCHPDTQIYVVWEDDDIYLPHHISTHVAALQSYEFFPHSGFSKPSTVLSTYPGHVVTEGAAGRFHASIAFTRGLYEHCSGWPHTKRADFDQRFLSRLSTEVRGEICDPCLIAPPSYCFRYGSTQAYHGQHFMRSPGDETWYDRVPHQPGKRDLRLEPKFDVETLAVYASRSVKPGNPAGPIELAVA